jgi:cell division protein FtsN
MLFGLGIGLIVALGVWLNGPKIMGAKPEVPLAASAETVRARQSAETAGVVEPSAVEVAADEARQAATSPAGRGGDDEDPDRFSFYDLLPSFEVVVPEVETRTTRAREIRAIEAPGIYMLQAGSFLTNAEAEAQRARLGLLGIESRIQRVTIDDRAFHRVRIGPIENLDELNALHSRLQSADVESLIMRVDP